MKRKHEWVRRARIFLMDNYHPPFWPDLTFDAKKLVGVVTEYHANAIRLGSAGKWAVFPNEFWPEHPQLNGRDLLNETIAEARAHGVRVIAYIPVGHIIPDDNILQHHPEWLYRAEPGSEPPPRFHHGGGAHRAPCFNTPYRDAVLGFAAKVVADHEIDAVYTDSATPYHSHPTAQSSLCYCDYCREKFETEFGRAMPYAPDPHALQFEEQEALEKWSLEYGRIVSDLILEFADRVRETRDIPLLTHGCGMGRWPERQVMDAHDGLLYEAGGDFLHRLEAASLGESSGRVVWQYCGALSAWSRLQWFSRDLVEEAVASFASGGAVLAGCGVNLCLDRPRHFHQELAQFFGVLAENEELLDELHPTRCVAVPYVLPMRVYRLLEHLRFRAEPLDIRDRAGDVIANCRVRNPSQHQCIRGGFSAMAANHLPVQLIEESLLSDPAALARYPALFLPNIGHLTEAEVRAVTEYVKAGGGLLATYRTSLYGMEPDDLRDNFALSDLLGVDRTECEPDRLRDYHYHLWGAGTFDTYGRSVPGKWLADRFPQDLWPVNRFEFVRPRKGTDVMANIVWGGREEELLWPAVTCRTFGKGRVVYLAAPVEELHFQYRMLMIRDLLGAIIDWLCPEGRPLVMDGPDQLLAIPNEKPGVQVLFLVNHTGERVEHLPDIWPRYSQQFSYVPPVPEVNLRWRVPEGCAPRRVWDVCTGRELDATVEEGDLSVKLENIGQYGIIAAKF